VQRTVNDDAPFLFATIALPTIAASVKRSLLAAAFTAARKRPEKRKNLSPRIVSFPRVEKPREHMQIRTVFQMN